MVLYIVTVTLILSIIMCIARMVKGHTVYDRILAANSFGTIIMVLIVIIGYYFNYHEVFDIALIYALINFVATIGFLKFFTKKSFYE